MYFSFKASSEAFFPNVHLSSIILTLFQHLEVDINRAQGRLISEIASKSDLPLKSEGLTVVSESFLAISGGCSSELEFSVLGRIDC